MGLERGENHHYSYPYPPSVLPSSHPFLHSSPSTLYHSLHSYTQCEGGAKTRVKLKRGYELTTHLVLHQLELNLSVDTGKVPVPV